ncbi:hypothetical protein [Nocardia goodfellowii]|uniref:DUF320 domain-containing protein n=1 Tax=Nocardia goodfellowii TaxID=882446 RepID=A0ABS4QRG1_9NOCA|nr:hypothetical protein [Nocardia goodfellowii]MBP2194269.1 hypothetical protein [Nocardia goodfellowii]
MRSAVIAAFVGATLVSGTAPAGADTVAGTGSATTGSSAGSAGGVTTTGSGETGSAGGLERLLFGGPLICAAVGSAFNANLTCPGTPGPTIPLR